MNLFFHTEAAIDTYYKLQVTRIIENALKNQINSLSLDNLRSENRSKCPTVYTLINTYSKSILKGYEYTYEYLDSVNKDSEYIHSTYNQNSVAYIQLEIEIENKYNSLYGN